MVKAPVRKIGDLWFESRLWHKFFSQKLSLYVLSLRKFEPVFWKRSHLHFFRNLLSCANRMSNGRRTLCVKTPSLACNVTAETHVDILAICSRRPLLHRNVSVLWILLWHNCSRNNYYLLLDWFRSCTLTKSVPSEPSRARLLTALTVTDSYVTTLPHVSTDWNTYVYDLSELAQYLISCWRQCEKWLLQEKYLKM